jgi:RNA polymerase sigma-70 factor (ECF subfamily)
MTSLKGAKAVLLDGRAVADGAFTKIVDGHHAEIHRYLRRVVSRGAEADDLLQETFVRAFRAYRSLPADADVRAWLFAIATHLCRNHVRSARKERPSGTGGGGSEIQATTKRREAQETQEILGDAIDGLPVTQRLAVAMRKLHGLEYEAIGASLHCSAETARGHVFRALRRIHRALEECLAA